MGTGISAACLMAGLRVTMIERNTEIAETAAIRVGEILSGAQDRGKMTAKEKAEALQNFEAITEYSALSDADLVIEAVFEDMDVKREVFEQLDQVTRPDAVLASNTSYLDIAVLAKNTKYPDRVIGLHFFSPAHIMKLLEVIIPNSASGQAVATGLALGKRLRKISVPAGVCDGFIGNRIMSAYRREADYMIEDGALPLEIDAAMRSFGFQIGVFQMQDLAGLDIAWAMRKRKAANLSNFKRYVSIADRLCEVGRFGRKTGKGWYDYTDDPKGAVDPEVTKIIENERTVKEIKQISMSENEIMSRILNVMQTEGQMVLEEGIAATSEAIDVVMVNGYGFPRWRGGPMFIAKKSKVK
jgi:3-hydroxyacyl-CoA dehydrogenase